MFPIEGVKVADAAIEVAVNVRVTVVLSTDDGTEQDLTRLVARDPQGVQMAVARKLRDGLDLATVTGTNVDGVISAVSDAEPLLSSLPEVIR